MQTEIIKKEYPFDITPINFKITTTSELAQTWFSIGLSQCYNFNHEEGIYCCEQALKHDPNCAMAYFLISFALGVNYNNIASEFTEQQAKDQFENYSKAEKNIQNLSKLETLLIQALKERVGNGVELKHDVFDKNFTVKMKEVYNEFGSDPSVACLYAESLMNLRPWNLWAQKTEGAVKYGDPYENTQEIKNILENALAKHPNHVGLRHLWIHCVELSKQPELGLDNKFQFKLRDLGKDQSHLVHMVSHIDLISGNYEDAMIANELAVLAGDKYYKWREQVNKPITSFNNLYRCHDIHFWIYASMFAGQYAKSVEGARKLIKVLPLIVLKDTNYFNPTGAHWLEGFIPTILHVYIRFGQWEKIIQDEPFGEDLITMKQINENKDIYLATNCHLDYARGIAYAVLAGKTKTNEERQKFLDLSQEYLQKLETKIKLIPNTYTLFNNKISDVLQIGVEMLKGELNYRQENYEVGFKHLRISVEKYDNLPYDEPWGWMVPSRHALGALSLEYGVQTKNKEIISEAQNIYKQDLGEGISKAVAHPNNIWSLLGLYQCYVQLGKDLQSDAEMKEIKKQLDERMKFSDMQIKSSCFCTIKNLF